MDTPIDVVNTIKSLVGKNQYTNREKRVVFFPVTAIVQA